MPDGTAVRAAMQRLLEVGGSRARSVTGTVGGAAFHHLEEGQGPPVVLLHGGSGGGANWFRLLPRLAEANRVLAPDLPGFGLSATREPSAPLGEAAADIIAEWLARLDVRNALVAGTSFGGLVALRLAQRHPRRVGRLLLLDSAGLGRRFHPAARCATIPLIAGPALRPTRRGTRAVLTTLLTADRRDLPAEMLDALADYLYASARAAGTPYVIRTLRLFGGLRGQREVVTPAELAELPQPISLVWGGRDRFLPVSHARRAVRYCRNARLEIIENAGHSPNWEAPAAVAAAFEELLERPAM
jgi:pimeloyl-ACP methyl ester carboxylesterase